VSAPRHPPRPDPHSQAVGWLYGHWLLGPVLQHLRIYPVPERLRGEIPPGAWCVLEGSDTIYFDADLRLNAPQWAGVLSLAVLMQALDAPHQLDLPDPASDMAAQLAALHWWRTLKIGELPDWMDLAPELLAWGRLPLPELAARLRQETPDELRRGNWLLSRSASVPMLRPGKPVQRWQHGGWQRINLQEVFAQALVDNARRALQAQHEASHAARAGANANSPAAMARRWLITHYPLLGSLLTQFELVEDVDVCRRMEIGIAAIHVGNGEIYLNPARGLTLEQAKFVLAHEVLHAGLAHGTRRRGRDAFLWNVACDFVINDWLLQMNVGTPPDAGMLYDEALRGLAAEDIYLRLATDLRLRRRLATLRGPACDMLDDADAGFFTDREAFCRRALAQGLDYHQASGRGTLPAGLVEAIRTLNQSPIPWQADLADWLRERFPLPEQKRTYARPSRRQSATPHIPRPRHVAPEEERATRTFGVVVDSSGSMQRSDLGKALGAVVSYAHAQGVQQVRLVYCDAQPYDEGFVDVQALATRARVRGRGGTVLQPALTLLETRVDFPKDGPILVITDGLCESELTLHRDHAFLLAPGGRLPFRTGKPVFQMQ
jgi:predicted metal-dependent peptidase